MSDPMSAPTVASDTDSPTKETGDVRRARAQPPKPLYKGDSSTYDVDPGKGWVLFAGIMLAVIGALNVVYGIAAIGNSKFYVRDVEFVFANLKTWGWLLLDRRRRPARSRRSGSSWRPSGARWLGIAFAVVNMVRPVPRAARPSGVGGDGLLRST